MSDWIQRLPYPLPQIWHLSEQISLLIEQSQWEQVTRLSQQRQILLDNFFDHWDKQQALDQVIQFIEKLRTTFDAQSNAIIKKKNCVATEVIHLKNSYQAAKQYAQVARRK